MPAVVRNVRQWVPLGIAIGLLLVAVPTLAACGGTGEPSAPAPNPPDPDASSSSSSALGPSPAPRSPAPARATPGSPSSLPSPETSSRCPRDDSVRSWYYVPNLSHDVPAVPKDAERLLRRYGGCFVGDTAEKVVYLTFDEGYENGYTAGILAELGAAGVSAGFFVTGDYVRDNPRLVRRMVAEGHIVGNHTDGHRSLPSLAGDTEAFAGELAGAERAFRRAVGRDVARLLRPPMGEYSARSLCLTRRLGYTTVFWSFAHRDWLVDDQPPVDVTVRRVLEGSHPGAVYLLHAVSRSNARALPAIISGLRKQGYRIGSPCELLEP